MEHSALFTGRCLEDAYGLVVCQIQETGTVNSQQDVSLLKNVTQRACVYVHDRGLAPSMYLTVVLCVGNNLAFSSSATESSDYMALYKVILLTYLLISL